MLRPFTFLAVAFYALPIFAQATDTPTERANAEPVVADSQLQNAIEPLLQKHRGDVGFAVRSFDGKVFYEFNPDEPMPTASLIKLPMMITAYRMVDQGKLNLATPVALRSEDKVPGSGILTDHFSSDVALPLRDYVRLMIRYSDNTATNLVADAIGLPRTAETMLSLGFRETKLHSKVYRGDTTIFPDRSRKYGIGSTTAREMVELLLRWEAGELASDASNEAMKEHLLQCEDASKLAALLPETIPFAHKTGAIANCRTDAGILYTDSGPIAVCFLTNNNKDQSWTDENEANALAANVGALIAERFGTPEEDDRLQEGSFGELVEALQRTLNARLSPSSNLSIDGDFGPATRSAVMRFQRENQLAETGIVSADTWKALGTLVGPAPVPLPADVNSQELSREPQASLLDPPIVTCKAWAIADDSGQVLFQHNANTPLEAASTTKIMTAYLVVRHAAQHPEVLDERVQFSSRADNTVGSTAGVRAGESLTVRELLYGLLLPSGNDASVAFAEHFGKRLMDGSGTHADPQTGTENSEADESYQQFIAAMNQAASELNMEQATYTNPHGLPNEAHVISAADLLKLSQTAWKDSLFRQVCGTRQYGCTLQSEKGYERNVVWKNTNRLLQIEGYDGVKTGTTSAAGACLVATGRRQGNRLTVVILGSSSSPARYADVRNLFHWAWKQRGVE